MKILSVLFVCLAALFLSSSESMPKDNAILWSEKPLEWTDFRGRAASLSPHQAVTSTQVRSGNGYPTKDTVEYEVTCLFIPSTSWVRKESRGDTQLLAHEQLHFDISEYTARLSRQQLTESPVSIKECNDNLILLRDSIGAINKSLQAQYDRETDHGIWAAAQDAWRVKVDSLLEVTEGYKETVFRVGLIQ